ncbi:hypothetical protein FACS1894147_00150 [Spirochaetia bacterium]|nr:hypothetical protein FACS1894147_00150 [Spirochaetia bacterium]
MYNRRNTKQSFAAAVLLGTLVCALALGGCKNFFHPDGPSDSPPDPAGPKTLVQFNNLEVSPVTVYSDSAMTAKIADVGVGKTVTVGAAPAPGGASFYPRYHLSVEGIQLPPYDGEAIIARIDENRTNPVAIPPLEAIEAGDAFVKLENASTAYSLTMKKGSVEMLPIGKGSSIVMQNETASYSVPPGASSGYSLIRNPSTPVAFPAGLNTFSPGYLYLLRYDGSTLTLKETARPVFQLRYTIRYDANGGGGTAPLQQAVNQGAGAATAEQGALSRTGYTFSGWNTNANGTGTSYTAGSSITPTANITLYAKWTAITYTISYNANGGSGAAPSPQSAGYGSSLVISNQGGLSLAGRIFDGWNTNANGTGTSYPEGSSITANAGLVLYAQWIDPTTIRYTVTYNANGGSGTAPSSQMATNGTIITVSNPGGLSYSGKGFIGWNTSPSGGGIAYAAGSSLTMNGTVTLFAQWVTQYTVSYVANGGSGIAPASQTVNSGSSVTVAGQGSLSRTGCTFNGWNTNSSGTGTAYPAGSSITVSGNITLYAYWTVKVTYNANGGSGTAPGAQTVTSGSSVTLTGQGTLTRTGCVFGGWNTSSSGLGTNYFVGASLTVIENVTLYAKWIAPIVTTLAGSGVVGYLDGTGTAAEFYSPTGVAVDNAGNVYVADYADNRIRKISPSGVVTTLAGSSGGYADGTGTAAKFDDPYGVAVDNTGNVYVADSNNHRIRKISPSGVVTTLAGSGASGWADGTGTAAQFNGPVGVAVDNAGNVYVADRGNHRIRKISPSGVVTTLAGSGASGYANGTGTAAQFRLPRRVAVDNAGTVYVTDPGNSRIRKISPGGVVTTLAGDGTYGYADGTGTAAKFSDLSGVAVDNAGTVYVVDSYINRIRKISPGGVVTTLAGDGTYGYADGTGAAAQFNYPQGVAVDNAGNVYVADMNNHRIRKIEQ